MNPRLVLPLGALVAAAGCSATTTSTAASTEPTRRASAYDCEGLATLGSGEVFGDPFTVVDSYALYRYEGRQQRRIPTGVAVHVRAEPGLTAPLVHRVVACRMDGAGEGTRVSVEPRGPTFRVSLSSRHPEDARSLQARFDQPQR